MYTVVGANVPNYQGMFLRGYGSQNHTKNNGSLTGSTTTNHLSGNINVIQGDSTRNVWAQTLQEVRDDNKKGMLHSEYGALYQTLETTTNSRGLFRSCGGAPSNTVYDRVLFDSTRIVPVANEIRPVNVAVKYLILASN